MKLSVFVLSVTLFVMLNVIFTEYCNAECHYVNCFMVSVVLSVVKLNVIMLSVALLIFIMLSVTLHCVVMLIVII